MFLAIDEKIINTEFITEVTKQNRTDPRTGVKEFKLLIEAGASYGGTIMNYSSQDELDTAFVNFALEIGYKTSKLSNTIITNKGETK